MAIAWPFKRTSRRTDYGYELADLLDRTDFAVGSAERQLFTDLPNNHPTATLTLSLGEHAEFEGWFKYDVKNGKEWILAPVLAAGTVELREIKLQPPISFVPYGAKFMRASMSFRTRKGTAPSLEFYEFLKANGGGDSVFKSFDLLHYVMNDFIPSFAENHS